MNSNRNGAFVPSSEAERFTLHQTLRSLMPEAVADTLMAHLPPAGWSDVARKSDIEALREATKNDIDALRVATKHDIEELRIATKHDIEALHAATKHDIEALQAATKHDIDELRIATKHDIDLLSVRLENVEARLDSIEVKLDDLASMKRYVVSTGVALAALISGFGVPLLLAVA